MNNNDYNNIHQTLLDEYFNKQKSKKNNITKKLINNIYIFSTVVALSLSGFNLVKSANYDNDVKVVSNVENTDLNSKNLESGKIIKLNQSIFEEMRKNSEEAYSNYLKLKKKIKKAEKQQVLYNFKKIKSLDDILERQKELESLNLTKKDKLYKDCKLPADLQWFIFEQSFLNKVPTDLGLSIIDTETRGQFNSSGLSSYNVWDGSYDLGLTQQNTKSSVLKFCEKYNVSYEKACKLIKNNDYVNIVSCFLEFEEIETRVKDYDPIEYAGCYNGWVLWREKEISRDYVEIFKKAYYNKYTKYHNVTSKKEIKEKINKNSKVLSKVKY